MQLAIWLCFNSSPLPPESPCTHRVGPPPPPPVHRPLLSGLSVCLRAHTTHKDTCVGLVWDQPVWTLDVVRYSWVKCCPVSISVHHSTLMSDGCCCQDAYILGLYTFMHHAGPSGVYQSCRVIIMPWCSPGKLLTRVLCMHNHKRANDTFIHHATLKCLQINFISGNLARPSTRRLNLSQSYPAHHFTVVNRFWRLYFFLPRHLEIHLGPFWG